MTEDFKGRLDLFVNGQFLWYFEFLREGTNASVIDHMVKFLKQKYPIGFEGVEFKTNANYDILPGGKFAVIDFTKKKEFSLDLDPYTDAAGNKWNLTDYKEDFEEHLVRVVYDESMKFFTVSYKKNVETFEIT